MHIQITKSKRGLDSCINRLCEMLDAVGAIGVLDTMMVFRERIHKLNAYDQIMGSPEFYNLVHAIYNRKRFSDIHRYLREFDRYLKTVDIYSIPWHCHWDFATCQVEMTVDYTPTGSSAQVRVETFSD